MKSKNENHSEKNPNQVREKIPHLFPLTLAVMWAAFSKVDHNYKHQFPQREILHQNAPPHVQAVNQYLDQKGVDLHPDHVQHFDRGSEIDSHEGTGYQHNLEKWAKTIKNENKIRYSFLREVLEELQKGIEADQKKIVYARAGWLAHSIFGSIKAAANPYVAFEDDLGIGTATDYFADYCPSKRSSL